MSKCIVVGVTGGIAAYKAAQLVSNLRKKNYEVHVIMTKNATEFITPLTFETLSNNRVSVDTFDRNFEYNVQHISLAKKADCFVIAPATANVIAKVVHGLADDMLTTTFMAAKCAKIICPAMNTGMLENPVTQNNLILAKQLGYTVLESGEGYLACGDSGKGRLADLDKIEEVIEASLQTDLFLKGKKVLISAGATQEAIDPVRFITNHSTGKMGYALAHQAQLHGAEVNLIAGKNVALKTPLGVNKITVGSANEMFNAIKENYQDQDIIIKAAAVADYTPIETAENKIKKKDGNMQLELKRTQDILAWLGAHKKENQFLCGFAMETENLIENATEKLVKKNADMIVANSLNEKGAGFGTDTNRVTLLTKASKEELSLLSKEEVAYAILKNIISIQEK